MKHRIAYVGGQVPPGFDSVWGGTPATNHAYIQAFRHDSNWQLDMLPRDHIRTTHDIKEFCQGADIIHLDDTSVCAMMYEAGITTPDVIGPITRSPLKTYGDWTAPYSADWFYQARVIRLNYNEERQHKEKVTLITHGVDTDRLIPDTITPKTGVLWAGQAARPAKNHDLWLEIQQQQVPQGYEYRTLSQYVIQDYWNELSSTAVVVCTSLYESFCNAAFEALACGVPVVWQKGLHGKRTRSSMPLWEDAGIRCDYTVEGFHAGIEEALIMNTSQRMSMRQYVLDHCSLRHMRDSYVKVFNEVLYDKKV